MFPLKRASANAGLPFISRREHDGVISPKFTHYPRLDLIAYLKKYIKQSKSFLSRLNESTIFRHESFTYKKNEGLPVSLDSPYYGYIFTPTPSLPTSLASNLSRLMIPLITMLTHVGRVTPLCDHNFSIQRNKLYT